MTFSSFYSDPHMYGTLLNLNPFLSEFDSQEYGQKPKWKPPSRHAGPPPPGVASVSYGKASWNWEPSKMTRGGVINPINWHINEKNRGFYT